jgi:hypothetical protein
MKPGGSEKRSGGGTLAEGQGVSSRQSHPPASSHHQMKPAPSQPPLHRGGGGSAIKRLWVQQNEEAPKAFVGVQHVQDVVAEGTGLGDWAELPPSETKRTLKSHINLTLHLNLTRAQTQNLAMLLTRDMTRNATMHLTEF